REIQRFVSGILKHERHMNQWWLVHLTLGLKVSHQHLERQILMCICPQSDCTRPSQQLLKSRIAGQIVAQNQQIDEKTYQRLDFYMLPMSNGNTDGNLILPGVAAQQS